MILVAVQCRLASARLPGKALFPLGRESLPLVAWTLRAMKRVPADAYWLACDTASYDTLQPIAYNQGWNCFAGPEDNVLERFCLLAQKTGADVIVRATADNPFLFYEAAQASVKEFLRRTCDYFTYTGLPHGSGIEVLSARALIEAHKRTRDAFECEHVGPALYNHKDTYTCIFEPAPSEWNYPHLRTTVDTADDYRNACRVCSFLEQRFFAGQKEVPPYTACSIVEAVQNKSPQTCGADGEKR
ncbi:hypothetical protein H0R92_10185 [Treponema sp. OMZ 840]|uniref:cytidylyltransferase domain-containing protein n=1 Tax=Treponema sp. OMZ 840 TaxID=244313 RepID=UPI003D8BD617